MQKFCVSVVCLCMSVAVWFASGEAHEKVHLAGQLVKKPYPAPRIVENTAFGWYLELNPESQEVVHKRFQLLSQEDQCSFRSLKGHMHMVQCVNGSEDLLLQFRSLEGASVAMVGELGTPRFSGHYICFSIAPKTISSQILVHNLNPTPVDQFERFSSYFLIDKGLDEEDPELPLLFPEGVPEQLVTLKGKLLLRLFPGPPEYSSIERGDRAEYCWVVHLDEESFKIATTTQVPEPCNTLRSIMNHSNRDEVSVAPAGEMLDFYCAHEGREVIVQGYLFHAHTAHHRTPILMDVKKISE